MMQASVEASQLDRRLHDQAIRSFEWRDPRPSQKPAFPTPYVTQQLHGVNSFLRDEKDPEAFAVMTITQHQSTSGPSP